MPAGPRATAESVPISDVELDDDFWTPRVETNREVTIAHQYDQLEANGCLANFRRVARGATADETSGGQEGDSSGEDGAFEGPMFIDSDAYKWLEAASYVLATGEEPDLRERVNEVIELLADAQEDDGYLHTYFQLVEPEMKWTNLAVMHELYCAGHLIEAAVAHYRATGSEGLLDVARAFADHIDRQFGPDGQNGVPGHEEIELALVKLYRVTGEERYLDLAEYFVDARGQDPSPLADELANVEEIAGADFVHHGQTAAEGARNHFLRDGEYDGSYAQDHLPLREQETVEGHAVRAMYFYTGVTSLLQERDDEELWTAIQRLWENMTTKRMYVTGGIGSEHEHEGFTEDYDLPNDTAYAETCAAIGSIFWNHRLFELTAERDYADLIERTLYNGFLAGVSVSGDRFFYVNPLETTGDHHRKEWFYVACCPPNAARLLASLERYIYARGTDGETLYVNQFVGSSIETELGEDTVALTQSTAMPWEGETNIKFTHDDPGAFELRVRIPEWVTNVEATVNGETIAETNVPSASDDYLSVERTWEAGDEVALSFSQPVEVLAADPRVRDDAGRVAVRRGPLVYCVEDADHSVPVETLAVSDPDDFDPDPEHDPDLLGGTTVLRGEGTASDLDTWTDSLYRSVDRVNRTETEIVAIPYFAWDNREDGAMTVWIPTT
ncbi:glycoside hydrolase family 127 protein [Halorhabdus amylolytica]|uniref:glycoside hydrolase family 127 protein n=1 Tax=Halorhabdus amylolytica TaxID=2559573 RepID=UPI0010AA2197|nr:beta-L-arabinofuranosidase domain-containing protein [Halorhabdus amylolytica]